MAVNEQEELKNKRAGLIISVSIHVVLLLVFLFIVAWREPDPPLPEYGIELNFGLDNVGTGEIQPEQPATPSESEEEAAPEELPEPSEEVVEETPVEEMAAEPVEEVVETSTNVQESPDVVEKEVKPKKTEVKKEVEKKVETPKETAKPVENKEVTKPANGANGTDGENKTPQNANHGDNENEEGDKGDPQGSLDSRALYGNRGGGGGSALDMTGWMWDYIPKPKDSSNENGRIVFEVKIDDMGEIISVKTLIRSVSPAVEKIYRAEVEKLTFSRTSDNTIAAPISTGKITFVIKSK